VIREKRQRITRASAAMKPYLLCCNNGRYS
jgi:hypothetical protein